MRVRAVLDAQGMDEDGRRSLPHGGGDSTRSFMPTTSEARRFLSDLGQGKVIEVTPTLISNITGVPCVHDPVYPWPVDRLPIRTDIVECFAEGCPLQMETEGEDSFQLSDLSNDVQCIYNILTSRVHPVLSHTMITIERAYCLYALLTEASIDFGSLVTAMMMLV
jgi:hypothetical protein